MEDPQLWRYIDARQEPNSTKKVNYVCDRVHDKTLHILLRAESKYVGVLPQQNLIGWNQLEQLTVLALENERFDGRSVRIKLNWVVSSLKCGGGFLLDDFAKLSKKFRRAQLEKNSHQERQQLFSRFLQQNEKFKGTKKTINRKNTTSYDCRC